MNYEALDHLFNQLYEFAVRPEHHDALKRAEKAFIVSEDFSDTNGFTEWFIFNYRDQVGGSRLIDQAIVSNQEDEINQSLLALGNSLRSLFEIRTERGKSIVKDIFTGEDFLLNHAIQESNLLLSARLISIEHENYLIGDIFEFDLEYRDTFKKIILENYNQYVNQYGPTPLAVFLDLNGHLLCKIMEIVHQVDEENAYEQELMLHQATYAYNCTTEELYDRLMTIKFPVYSDEDEEPILRVMEEDQIIAEIEITNSQLYVLCNNESHLNKMIEAMTALISHDLVFLKSETFTLEELL